MIRRPTTLGAPTLKSRVRPTLKFLIFATFTLVAACSEPPGDQAGAKIPVEMARAVSVSVVELRSMASNLIVSGILTPRDEASVHPEISGYRVSEVLFEEGAHVEAGDILARLNPALLQTQIAQAKASLEQASAQARQTKSELARVEKLAGKNVLSEEAIESARTQTYIAIANTKLAMARLDELKVQLQRLEVRAPVSGLILERNVREGEIANQNTQMFRIARDALIEVAAEVPEQDLHRINPGQVARVILPSNTEISGQVRLIFPSIDPDTKLGQVRIQLPIDAQLRPGGYARVQFSRSGEAVPAIPEKAVHYEASGPSVIVIDDDNRARRVAIQTSSRIDGYVALRQGPEVGSRVALGGGAFLLEGDLVNPIEPPGHGEP